MVGGKLKEPPDGRLDVRADDPHALGNDDRRGGRGWRRRRGHESPFNRLDGSAVNVETPSRPCALWVWLCMNGG
jgi:hypothetical protein